jgi:hypothetical protein
MGGIQVVAKWEVHVAPLGALRWDGAFERRHGLFGHLRLGLQLDVDYGPPQG